MIAKIPDWPRIAALALAAATAAVLAWRVVVAGTEALSGRSPVTDSQGVRPPLGAADADARWRQRIARNPADAAAVLMLGLELERQGRRADADAAIGEALRLAPGDPQALLQAAGYLMRTGDDARALATLRRAVDAQSSDGNINVWPIFSAALDTGRHRAFFDAIARDNPRWWSAFFRVACARAANVGAVEAVFATRVEAAVATADERRCLIDRLQRDGYWTSAHQLWLNSLPVEQRQRVGHVFNGDFELPLSNLGFDWMVPVQDGLAVTAEASEGMTGQRALSVSFGNKRYAVPPIHQYLLLQPGRYRFEGRGRTDLESWLGLQWGVYCQDGPERTPRQLAHSGRFVGTEHWRSFSQDFVVPKDCPVQLLRLELANPKRDATTPGAVATRLNGRAWFDDLRMLVLD